MADKKTTQRKSTKVDNKKKVSGNRYNTGYAGVFIDPSKIELVNKPKA